MKYKFRSRKHLIFTLEAMANKMDQERYLTDDPNFRSFYSGKAAGFRDVITFLSVSHVDDMETSD
jgi:hypothetical protein